jgi:hypothetical protein
MSASLNCFWAAFSTRKPSEYRLAGRVAFAIAARRLR